MSGNRFFKDMYNISNPEEARAAMKECMDSLRERYPGMVDSAVFQQFMDFMVANRKELAGMKLPTSKKLLDSMGKIMPGVKVRPNNKHTMTLTIDLYRLENNFYVCAICLIQNKRLFLHQMVPLGIKKPSASMMKQVLEQSINDIGDGDILISGIICDTDKDTRKAVDLYCKEHRPATNGFVSAYNILEMVIRQMFELEELTYKGVKFPNFIYFLTDSKLFGESLIDSLKGPKSDTSEFRFADFSSTKFCKITDAMWGASHSSTHIAEIVGLHGPNLHLEKYHLPSNLVEVMKDPFFWDRMKVVSSAPAYICTAMKELQQPGTHLSDVFIMISHVVFNICLATEGKHGYWEINDLLHILIDYITDPVIMLATYLDIKDRLVKFTPSALRIIEDCYKSQVPFRGEQLAKIMKGFENFKAIRETCDRNYLKNNPKLPIAIIANQLLSIQPRLMPINDKRSIMGWVNDPEREQMTIKYLTRATKVYLNILSEKRQDLNTVQPGAHNPAIEIFTGRNTPKRGFSENDILASIEYVDHDEKLSENFDTIYQAQGEEMWKDYFKENKIVHHSESAWDRMKTIVMDPESRI